MTTKAVSSGYATNNGFPRTRPTAVDYTPDWSPDGQKIAFEVDGDFEDWLYGMNPDGSQITRLAGYSSSSIKTAPPATRSPSLTWTDRTTAS